MDSLRVHITNTHHMIGVAKLAQHMVTDIATKELGFREIGVFQYHDEGESKKSLNARFDGMLAGVEMGDVIVFQSPSWNSVEWDTALFKRTLVYDHLKRIIFIHDVIPLMWKSNRYLLEKWIKYYNMADVIIVPSQYMADFLRKHGLSVKKIVIQKMWDHKVDIDLGKEKPQYTPIINFAGDPTNPEKYGFGGTWFNPNVKLRVFTSPKEWGVGRNIEFVGSMPDASLLNNLRHTGGFGLIWSGDPYWLEYMKMNCSFKLSTYLAAGLPVIVNSSTPARDIIEKKNLGIIADTLPEAIERVQTMTTAEYDKMVESINEFAKLIQGGYFTKRALTEAIFKAFYE
ncbi:sugar transferase [Limosilactobacillus fastidiosus]|uniref:sugar transferase n=1 Tax=Limosilactobacillus fastidiosus TaxID=2759855 RepID=UPI002D7EFFB7|nr:sugar transferase [Limosilactobacillus fastidiosus]